ncbi:MAG: hypothetical protein LAO07_13320 [Acidobacteriia bacterium]|nr:hypothetical protein [Terriglobia bacterium]
MFRRPVWQMALLVVMLGLPGALLAQTRTVIPLVPAADWHLMVTQPLGLEAVRQWGGDPVIEREYGVKMPVERKYHLGERTADALFEEAADPTAAYGLLTFYQTDSMLPVKGVELALEGPEGALMARGRFFVRAARPTGSKISDNDFRALLVFIGGTRPAANDAASLPPPLPAQGLIRGSEKYLLGLEVARRVLPDFRTELIGFTQGAEAHVGGYQIGSARPKVVAITYPTPQIARARFGAMESLLGINQDRGPDSAYGRRSGSFVFLVLDAGSVSVAGKLLNLFQVSSSVSWNEKAPDEHAFTLQVVQLVLANLFLSFLIAGFAVGGGIIIFLSRRAATRFFPQWTWADTERETIIRLNLR